jgi:holo-[acyl-carrier protein] synthase
MVIGLGSDIVSVRRIKKVFIRRPGFPSRILTESEYRIFIERNNSMEFLSGRFAAKEAVLKAFGTGLRKGLIFKEIEVEADSLGAPSVNLYGKAQKLFSANGGKKIFITISHDKDYAMAFALIES